jgi:hypothetical protein
MNSSRRRAGKNIVRIPGSYEVEEVTPAPDIRREDELVWTGPRSFNSGKTEVVFEKSSPGQMLTAIMALPVLILGIGVHLLVKRKDNKRHVAQ